MPERKPLTAGLTVVPPGTDGETVRAFVSQETRQNQHHALTSDNIEPQSARESESVDDKHHGKRQTQKTAVRVGLIPVTVRLRPEIAAALKRASLERQLAGTEPHTQQEVVEQALRPWLIREGFLE